MGKKKGKMLTVLDTLRLFKEKADKLRASSYLKQLPNQDWSYHFDNVTGDFSIVDVRPEDESREALILTLRFFDQGELKLEKMAALYRDLPVSEEHKYSVAKSFKTFEKALASGLGVSLKGITYKSDRLFKIFMYGEYCHADKFFREQLELFRNGHPITSMMLNQEFDKLVALHLEYTFWLCGKNDIAIKALEARSAA